MNSIKLRDHIVFLSYKMRRASAATSSSAQLAGQSKHCMNEKPAAIKEVAKSTDVIDSTFI
jgi:hypothetical protein